MLKLYHVNGSRSIRIRWLLEELGLDYELGALQFSPEALQSPDYVKLNPLGKVPALVDGDTTLFESGAIVEYILEKYNGGHLKPEVGSKEWERFLIWMHGAESVAWHVAMFFLNTGLIPEEDRSDAIIENVRGRALFVLGGVEKDLGDRPFICGDAFTGADCMFAYGIHFANAFGLVSAKDHPNLTAYYQRIKKRPAFQKAIAD
jgi:glutathione S-transferase